VLIKHLFVSDPFSVHFEKDLAEDFVESLGRKEKWKREEVKVLCKTCRFDLLFCIGVS
jgi:hypothetical protein